MKDLQKTFLAGFGVLLVLLVMPYYLNFIGYNNDVSVVEEVVDDVVVADLNQNNSVINSDNRRNLSQAIATDNEETEIIIETDLYIATLSNIGGGSLKQYTLNGSAFKQFVGGYNADGLYNDSINVDLILNNKKLCAPCVFLSDQAPVSTPFNIQNMNLNNVSSKKLYIASDDSLEIIMTANIDGVLITKQTVFFGDSYVSNHYTSTNTGSAVGLMWDKGIRNTEKNLTDEVTAYAAAYISQNKEINDLWFNPASLNEEAEHKSLPGNIDWAGIRNKYFIMAFVPNQSILSTSMSASSYLLNNNTVVPSYELSVLSNQNNNTHLYLGPLDIDHIQQLDTSLDRIMNFGWYVIQPFSRGVLWLLKLLHSFGLNYGLVLILFAFLIRIVTGPLTKKAFQSSQKMATLQPKMKQLQTKHKGDAQRLNQETVKLYRESGVNPLGGCLPMLLQMPLLFSLFLVFRSTIEFRGAPFIGWISNLSQPDTLFYLPFHIPIYGDQVALLPILLGISMFLTQRLSMATMDPQQKPIMYIMSVFFFLIFNSFPSGLNLYYLVYNLLNYQQQKSLKQT